jgi:hypothetical protein
MGEFFEDPDYVSEAVTLVAKFYESLLDIQTSFTVIVTEVAEALQNRVPKHRIVTDRVSELLNNPLPSAR